MLAMRKTKWNRIPILLGVFALLFAFGCNDDDSPVVRTDLPAEGFFTGTQEVLVTNANGVVSRTELDITAKLRFPSTGEVEMALIEKCHDFDQVCTLKGEITANKYLQMRYQEGVDLIYPDGHEVHVDKSFREAYSLNNRYEMNMDNPGWTGVVTEDQVRLSCDFKVEIPWTSGPASCSISYDLVRIPTP